MVPKMNVVDTFRAFSDPSRLRILHLLLQQPLCVCHLQELLDQPQVNVSQHLAYLRKAGRVEFTGVQTWKVYRLRSPRSRAVELSLCKKLDRLHFGIIPSGRAASGKGACRALKNVAVQLTEVALNLLFSENEPAIVALLEFNLSGHLLSGFEPAHRARPFQRSRISQK
jgi:DNA-binding transcriptional ArsR family regulator